MAEVVGAEDFVSRCDCLQRSLGLEPVKCEQLSVLLALFVLRELQTDDELTESLGVFWKVMSEFDLSSLPDVIRGMMYMADLLAEGEDISTIRPRFVAYMQKTHPRSQDLRIRVGPSPQLSIMVSSSSSIRLSPSTLRP